VIVRIVLGVVLASVRVRVARRTRSDNKQTRTTVNVKSAPDTKRSINVRIAVERRQYPCFVYILLLVRLHYFIRGN